MRKKFDGFSVSKKTVCLLVLFVLLPVLFISAFIVIRGNRIEREGNYEMTSQRLKNSADLLSAGMDNIVRMAEQIKEDSNIRNILMKTENSNYYQCRMFFRNILQYHPWVVKAQLLDGKQILWQYGPYPGYALDGTENENFLLSYMMKKEYDLWSPARVVHSLSKGVFEKEYTLFTYYHTVYDDQNKKPLGVLAFHMDADMLCDQYLDGQMENMDAVWLLNGMREIISSTDKSFLEGLLPEELVVDTGSRKEGREERIYRGKTVEIFFRKCGEYDNYLFAMVWKKSLLYGWFLVLVIIVTLFVLFCIIFLCVYRFYVILPLQKLSVQIEMGKQLELRQEELAIHNDEIGVLISGFHDMMKKIDELIQNVYLEKIRTQEAEQIAMLSQINPHFLYNTLDSIKWNAMKNKDREVALQLEALAVMLRGTLNFGEKYTTIENEMTIIHNYCFLIQSRFRKDITIHIDVDSETLPLRLPKLMIQPLVENAYKHGLEGTLGEKIMWIKVHRFHGKLYIYVADNGVGCNAAQIWEKIQDEDSESRDCFALRNLYARLRKEYGSEGIFHLAGRPGVGTLAKLILPIRV